MNRLDTTNFDWRLFRRDVKRDVRHVVLFCAFALIVNMLVVAVVTVSAIFSNPDVIQGIVRGATTGNYEDIMKLFMEDMSRFLSPTLLSAATMAGAVAGPLVFLIYRKKRFFGDLALPMRARLTPGIFITLLLGTQAIQCAYALIIQLVEKLLAPAGMSVMDSYSSTIEQFIGNPVGLVYIVLVGPIFEELVFRGGVLGALRKYGENFAVLISALCFGFFHMLIAQVPFAFVVGLLLGYAASRYTLRCSIALHILVNGLSMLAVISPKVEAAYGIAIVVCGIAFVVILLARRKHIAPWMREGAAYYERTYRYGLTSIPLIVYCVVLILVGFAQMQMV
ncbi:MAG: CPBP family intramembrane metalloprotease [Clostridiales Family XIII bacterium]|jgi:membrane protease YdiL (CAAX protease family)|nr:CPBP family intramembrane metalloprotease [Clostridiales Family XIII bacterium]